MSADDHSEAYLRRRREVRDGMDATEAKRVFRVLEAVLGPRDAPLSVYEVRESLSTFRAVHDRFPDQQIIVHGSLVGVTNDQNDSVDLYVRVGRLPA